MSTEAKRLTRKQKRLADTLDKAAKLTGWGILPMHWTNTEGKEVFGVLMAPHEEIEKIVRDNAEKTAAQQAFRQAAETKMSSTGCSTEG